MTISADITLDKLLNDIDQQLEILSAIAMDNGILNEQIRLLQESREMLTNMELEVERLTDMLSDQSDEGGQDQWTIIDSDTLRNPYRDD